MIESLYFVPLVKILHCNQLLLSVSILEPRVESVTRSSDSLFANVTNFMNFINVSSKVLPLAVCSELVGFLRLFDQRVHLDLGHLEVVSFGLIHLFA